MAVRKSSQSAGLLALAGAAAVTAALAGEPVLVNGATSYPEGPAVVGGQLFYAEMGNDRVVRYDGTDNRVFWWREGCAPTSVAPAGDGGIYVLCHRQGSVARVSATGETVAIIDRDEGGQVFVNPNAAASDGRGGIWFSSSGVFSPDAPAEGAVLHLEADGRLRRLVEGIHYANGVALSRDGATLYVSEHLERRVLAYDVGEGGALSGGRVAVNLDDLPNAIRDGGWWVGPDGLGIDRKGHLWIAEYGGGRIMAVSTEGKLLTTLPVKEAYTTAMAFGEDGRLFITAPASRTPHYGGAVYAVDNPLE
jgi:gluconolactonase